MHAVGILDASIFVTSAARVIGVKLASCTGQDFTVPGFRRAQTRKEQRDNPSRKPTTKESRTNTHGGNS
jgi:hypothetical protein